MRKIQKQLICVLLTLIFSCTTQDDFSTVNDTGKDQEKNSIGNTASRYGGIPNNMPIYSPTELVIQYKDGTSDTTKSIIRNIYDVYSYEECYCEDNMIEKWLFDVNVDIEGKKEAIESDDSEDYPDGEGFEEVDYEFDFDLELYDPDNDGGPETDYNPYIKPINNGPTIAVLDTGIATGFSVFSDEYDAPSSFLFNASEVAVEGETSGWNFVEENDNLYDDNDSKHGTVVAHIINSAMGSVPHQILPMKVCDASGRASYFNLVCGLNKALNEADIIQISLGWYDDGEGDFVNTIFSNLLETNDSALIVTSAGNNAYNNDTFAHYPSNYEGAGNVIAVASTNTDGTNIADFSNYGAIQVDFFAHGESIYFYDHIYNGTSYAAPMVAAKAAKIMYEASLEGTDLTPEDIINSLNTSGIPVLFDAEKPTKYNKVILP